jgi:hypothetical protein
MGKIPSWFIEDDRPVNGNPGFGKKLVRKPWGKLLDWDQRQLEIIANITLRYAHGEPIRVIAADLWRRRVRDHRGRLWGKARAKPGHRAARPYQALWRARRWFLSAGQRGELPGVLYNGIAQALAEVGEKR